MFHIMVLHFVVLSFCARVVDTRNNSLDYRDPNVIDFHRNAQPSRIFSPFALDGFSVRQHKPAARVVPVRPIQCNRRSLAATTCDLSFDMSETFLFTSESVNEGHPGAYSLDNRLLKCFETKASFRSIIIGLTLLDFEKR